MKTFSINSNKGFHITLPNGITVSTQFGGANYCENREHAINSELTVGEQSNDAEIAFYDDGGWRTQEVFRKARMKNPGDDVAGYIRVKDWLRLLDAARKLRARK